MSSEKKDAVYKFNENLLKLSRSKNIEDAKKEWVIICEDKREEKTGLCICQNKIKNIVFIYNIHTKYVIMVGSTCKQKFMKDNNKLTKSIFKKILKKFLRNGDYVCINDIIKYAKYVKKELLEYFEYKINNHTIDIILELEKEIKDIIDNYKLDYLDNIYDEIVEIKEEYKNNDILKYNEILSTENLDNKLILIKQIINSKFLSKLQIKEMNKCKDDIEKYNSVHEEYNSITNLPDIKNNSKYDLDKFLIRITFIKHNNLLSIEQKENLLSWENHINMAIKSHEEYNKFINNITKKQNIRKQNIKKQNIRKQNIKKLKTTFENNDTKENILELDYTVKTRLCNNDEPEIEYYKSVEECHEYIKSKYKSMDTITNIQISFRNENIERYNKYNLYPF